MLRQISVIVLSAFLAINLCGCAAVLAGAAGGVGTAAWLSGKLSSEIDAPYEQTIEASKNALDSLDMRVEKETRSDAVAQIISEYSDGSKVWIDIRPVTKKSVRIEIRVGARGDKAASDKILERIKKYL